MTANAKPVSATRLVMAQEMTPQDANPRERHGGNIMRLADSAAGVVAIRHSGRNCVTAAVDHFEFHARLHRQPRHLSRLREPCRAHLDGVGSASRRRNAHGEKTHTNSSYFLMVALDDQGRPVEVPKLLLETGRTAAGTRRQ